jgi:mannose-6-phosphate isomerase
MIHLTQQPLRFEPFFRPMVWGGRNIARYLGKNLSTTEPYGESWEISDHPLHLSTLATASLYGVTLRQLMEQHREDLLGAAAPRFAVFPWLIKLLDAQDWLSVQVHPDEEAVKKLCPGESAKSEAWYVLDAAPQSRIYAGLKPGVGAKQLREALEQGAVTECLHAFTPKRGDFIDLQAGTVHAVGGGVFLAEIQQTSDVTFRLFDWDRRDSQGRARPLHLDEGFASIHWDQGAVQPVTVCSPAQDHRQSLVSSPHFAIEHLRSTTELTLGGSRQLQTLIVTEGHGHFDNGEFVLAGDAWVLPAAMPSMRLQPEAPVSGLLVTLPASRYSSSN